MSSPPVFACANCGILPTDKPFQHCPCRTNTAYCSVECQKVHRPVHKTKCVILRDAKLGSGATDAALFDVLDRMRASGMPVRCFTAAEVDGMLQDGIKVNAPDEPGMLCMRCSKKIPRRADGQIYTVRYGDKKLETCFECSDDWAQHGHLYKPVEQRTHPLEKQCVRCKKDLPAASGVSFKIKIGNEKYDSCKACMEEWIETGQYEQ